MFTIAITAAKAAIALTALVHPAHVAVAPGDTLSGIAAANGVSLSAVEAANPQLSSNFNLIFPGQTVK